MKSEFEIDAYNNKRWYLNNYLHRDGGPAIEYANGDRAWYKLGQLHREDGPAIDFFNGHKSWHLNGLLHREDGPAIEFYNGDKSWYYHDKQIHCKNNEEFSRMIINIKRYYDRV